MQATIGRVAPVVNAPAAAGLSWNLADGRGTVVDETSPRNLRPRRGLAVLILSLVFSLVLLLTATYAARSAARSPGVFFACGFLFTFCTSFIGFVFPPVWMQAVALSAVVLVLRRAPNRGPRLALPLTGAVTAVVYGVAGWRALAYTRDYDRWRQQYPYESVEERVPVPAASLRQAPFTRAADQRLLRLQDELCRADGSSLRSSSLLALHQYTLNLFVNSPRFGWTRMIWPDEDRLTRGLREVRSVPQPVPRASPAGPAGVAAPVPTPAAEEILQTLHRRGVTDFAYPAGHGYVKDRRHVAGFEPHAFGQVPGPAERWAVETLDLVSLLRHEEPVAYVSADLPRMDQLREAPTRPLDGFETAGLEQLLQGEDLVTAEAGPNLRMLGSVRSAEQCVKCHGGERGDLLGAFSYTLGRKGP
jgi:hypothetical protein